MNDQTLLENYLLVLKSTVEVYVHGTLESSNEETHNLLNKSLNEILKMQSDTYNIMTKYGWYNIENVKKSIIKNTINKINSK